MQVQAIEIGKIAAMCAVSAGLAICSTHARAEEPAQQVAALEMPKPRGAAPVMTIGGLKAGQVMVIGAGTSEVMSTAAYAQRPMMTPAMKAAQGCIIK